MAALEAQTRPEPEVRAVRTAEEEAAYQTGARMGAQGILQAAGIGAAPARKMGAPIGEEQIIEAERLLMEYKKGKSSVERRIINAQQWWKLRNWEMIENERGT